MKLHLIFAAAVIGSGAAQAQFTSHANQTKAPAAPSRGSLLAPATPGGSFSGGGANCAAPVVLPAGPTAANVPFDNTAAASMGVATNPFEALCLFSGQTGIANEEWWSWTAASTGVARFDTCSGLAGVDTKIAIYANDCPNMTMLDPIACKDDNPDCANFEATITWPITAGTTYLIQLGTFAGVAGGASDFSIEELPPTADGQLDLGASQNSLGLVNGGDLMWMQVLDAGAGQTVNSVDVAIGTPGAVSPADGSPATVVVYQGDPVNGLTLVTSENFLTANSATDTFINVPLTTPAIVTGNYTVAAVMTHAAGELVASMDHTVNSLGRAWVAGDAAGALDINDPSTAAIIPPTELQSIQPANFDAVWLLRANVTTGTGAFASACSGDGGDGMGCTSCPCGNDAPMGTLGGCVNSSGQGALLMASGSASVTAADPTDLRFELSRGVANSFAVLTSGNALAPANAANPCFGLDSGVQSAVLDGLRCAVQSTQRHGGRPVDGNGDVGVITNGWGGANGPPSGIAAQGGFGAGQTRYFQVFLRELPGMICSTEQNTSQAVEVNFVP